MSRLVVPLQQVQLWHTGEYVLRAFLRLELKDAAGNWHAMTFRADSGADMTSLSAARAKASNLQFPAQGLLVPISGSLGTVVAPVRAGFLRFRVVGMAPDEYIISCHFIGDPAAQIPSGPPSLTFPRSLLAILGVADRMRFHFDATPQPPIAPHGTMTVERI